MINWQNPYSPKGRLWLKGNLHTHSTPQSPCGRVPLNRVLELYEKAGYDFLAISNHQQCTDVAEQTSMHLIPGIEWNSRNPLQDRLTVNYEEHLGFYGFDAPALEATADHIAPTDAIQSLANIDSLTILNHPNWLIPHHYSEESLLQRYAGADGVEIYNAVIDRHPGSADATMKWDRLLTEKGPILGFASDDSHLETDIGKGWLMVNVQENNVANLFSNLRRGNFYCSTGVAILDIGRRGDEIFCVADDHVHIEATGENGQIYGSSTKQLTISLRGQESSYLRFTLHGQGKAQAWSQPFFSSM